MTSNHPQALSIVEIQRKIAAVVEERALDGRRTYGKNPDRRRYVVREGKLVERERIK